MNIIFSTLNNLLQYLFNFTGDWGIAIVLLTVLVRLILLPASIKQKISIGEQQVLSQKINELKEKYKNDKKKLESEMQKYYAESAKSMLGCLVTLLQLPIISSLYFVIMRMPVEVGTSIIPWVASIKMSDKYFIIPLIYLVASLSPSLLSYIEYFKVAGQVKMTKANFIVISLFSILITAKAPIAIGIYFITTSLCSLFEEIGYRLYMRRKCFN